MYSTSAIDDGDAPGYGSLIPEFSLISSAYADSGQTQKTDSQINTSFLLQGWSGFAGAYTGAYQWTAKAAGYTAEALKVARLAADATIFLTAAQVGVILNTGKDAYFKIAKSTEAIGSTVATVGVSFFFEAASATPFLPYVAGFGAGFIVGKTIESIFMPDTMTDADVLEVMYPIALDLDNDGVELVNLDDSTVFFDIDGDNFDEKTGWVAPDDGLLVIDLDANGNLTTGDNQITSADEFVFTRHAGAEGADGDLEALALVYDSNADGVLNANDSAWSHFKVWRDIDQDGESDAGELQTLAEAGITSLTLSGLPVVDPTVSLLDNVVKYQTTFTKGDGSTGTAADVGFVYSTFGYQWDPSDPDGIRFNAENDQDVIELAAAVAHDYDLYLNGVVGAVGAELGDTLTAGSDADVLLDGGAGDDVLTGGGGSDWISGGAGADQLSGGAGQDVLFFDGSDTLVSGGAGMDVAILTSSGGVTMDLGAAGLEVVYGNEGADVLTNIRVRS